MGPPSDGACGTGLTYVFGGARAANTGNLRWLAAELTTFPRTSPSAIASRLSDLRGVDTAVAPRWCQHQPMRPSHEVPLRRCRCNRTAVVARLVLLPLGQRSLSNRPWSVVRYVLRGPLRTPRYETDVADGAHCAIPLTSIEYGVCSECITATGRKSLLHRTCSTTGSTVYRYTTNSPHGVYRYTICE
eukprot:COSAG02_NODE_2504_length_8663_cov_3.628211_6_plen_188_part_00